MGALLTQAPNRGIRMHGCVCTVTNVHKDALVTVQAQMYIKGALVTVQAQMYIKGALVTVHSQMYRCIYLVGLRALWIDD